MLSRSPEMPHRDVGRDGFPSGFQCPTFEHVELLWFEEDEPDGRPVPSLVLYCSECGADLGHETELLAVSCVVCTEAWYDFWDAYHDSSRDCAPPRLCLKPENGKGCYQQWVVEKKRWVVQQAEALGF